jgi:hypothetical protein
MGGLGMNGKGSKRRPALVSEQQVSDNWDAAFKESNEKPRQLAVPAGLAVFPGGDAAQHAPLMYHGVPVEYVEFLDSHEEHKKFQAQVEELFRKPWISAIVRRTMVADP